MNPPLHRPRRLRRSEGIRRLVRDTTLNPGDFVYPVFVAPGHGVRQEIGSMPGVFRFSADTLAQECAEAHAEGVGGVILFGLPEGKDESGSAAWDDDGVVPAAIRAIRAVAPDLVIATDVCLCEYTSHGHCGLLDAAGDVQNDPTVALLAQVALCHARAGADIVAPSDMMDGRVGAIRRALDAEGFENTALLSYAVKYASAFYGPFRDAADSAPAFGDRRGYQMDPSGGVREARREAALDVAEGADLLMVKPAMAYLDILRAVRDGFDLPVAAYNVSGEYAMIKAAAANGWIDGRRATLELLTAIRRAGADIILTYHAREAARWLREG